MYESCGNMLTQDWLLSFFILKLTRLRSKHEKEVGELNANLEEAYGSSNRSGNATKINELRAEVRKESLWQLLAVIQVD